MRGAGSRPIKILLHHNFCTRKYMNITYSLQCKHEQHHLSTSHCNFIQLYLLEKTIMDAHYTSLLYCHSQ